jgi:AcrR family transcriptional regulator
MAQPRQQRSEVSTRRLIDAAVELVAEGGYSHMTLAATGDRAGYSRGLVTTRFGNKENLLRAVAARVSERWWPYFEHPPAAANGLAELLALVRVVGEQVQADPVALRALQRLIFERATGPVDELQQSFLLSSAKIERDVAGIVERGRGDGSIRLDVVAQRTAVLVIAALRGISYQWFLHPEAVDMRALHEDLADQLARSLARGAGSARARPGARRSGGRRS